MNQFAGSFTKSCSDIIYETYPTSNVYPLIGVGAVDRWKREKRTQDPCCNNGIKITLSPSASYSNIDDINTINHGPNNRPKKETGNRDFPALNGVGDDEERARNLPSKRTAKSMFKSLRTSLMAPLALAGKFTLSTIERQFHFATLYVDRLAAVFQLWTLIIASLPPRSQSRSLT